MLESVYSKTMISAIIFDCFGVLVGSGFWDLYTSAGGNIKKDKRFIDDLLTKANSGQMTQAKFHDAICDKLNISLYSWREIVAKQEQPNKKLLKYIQKSLKPNFKIGLLSNANNGVVQRKLGDWLNVFDEVLVSAEVGLLKPDRRIFELACERIGSEPSKTIMIDDQLGYCLAATKLGMKYILYENFDQFKSDLNMSLYLSDSNRD